MSDYKPLFGHPIGPWHRWFAWRPIETVDRGWRWLVPTWRRRFQTRPHLDGPRMTWFLHVIEGPARETDG